MIEEEGKVTFTTKEYFQSLGYKCAYYSPPSGSWSKISFEINNKIYERFSSKKAKRPDIILYKSKKNGIEIIIVECKKNVQELDYKLDKYINTMNYYIKQEVLKPKYRHVYQYGRYEDWNKKVGFGNTQLTICFMVGGSYESFNKLVKANMDKKVVLGLVDHDTICNKNILHFSNCDAKILFEIIDMKKVEFSYE